jgi:signal transduction histidine kinase
MTLVNVVTMIGDDLTLIDKRLQSPGLADADWQAFYALRKHLDDQQRQLVGKAIKEGDATYKNLTKQLTDASAQLKTTIKDLSKVSSAITIISQIAACVDQISKLA